MKLPKIPLAQSVIKQAEMHGLKHVVISPGSRNAPLTIGFTGHPFFTCYSIVDERSAGFFALGVAQQLNEPVILVCTSGSALLNYFPAVSEAFYSHIPLIVISADRPEHLVGIGDGQTIDQKGVFGTHVLSSTNLKEEISTEQEESDDDPMILKAIENRLERFIGIQKSIQEQNISRIGKAFRKAIDHSGPVHLNVPFSEPLYETVDSFDVKIESPSKREETTLINDELIFNLADDWNSSARKMVLIGTASPGYIDQRWLDELARDKSVIVFTETNSNVYHPEFFPSIDKIIAPLDESGFQELKPDILITMGGMIVSKKIKAFLRKYQPAQHWHVGEFPALDTYFCLNSHVESTPNEFFNRFFSYVKKEESSYKPKWKLVKAHRARLHERYLSEIEYCDLKVFDQVLKDIPKDVVLQVGNSSAIRYTQLFTLDASLEVYCNRGTSGIDGSTSTAIGCSVASKKQTVFISGDLSFFYDSNALWNNYIPKNFRIILINNEGGGIFRILPGHKNTENFDRYFETIHKLTAKPLCDLYGFEYSKAENITEIKEAMKSFYKDSDKPKLLEIFTPRLKNDMALLNYFENIK